MKNIKYFKYKDTFGFLGFVCAYEYKLEDVIGFSFGWKKQYRGNILKVYEICFKDGEKEYFKEVIFKNLNEYRQSRLGFNGDKLLRWYEEADIRSYKRNL